MIKLLILIVGVFSAFIGALLKGNKWVALFLKKMFERN